MANPHPKPNWKKGQSGNPNGRPPKGYSITEWFQNMLASDPNIKEALGKSIIKKALEGDSTAQKLVWNYMDGMPMQKQEVSGPDGGPIPILGNVSTDNSNQETT